MNTLISDVLDRLVVTYAQSRTAYDAFTKALAAMPTELADTIFYDDYTLRNIARGDSSANERARLASAPDHATWKQFLAAHDAYYLCDAYDMLRVDDMPLMYVDAQHRSIDRERELAVFNRENATAVWENEIFVDNAKIKVFLGNLLARCGKSYLESPTLFSSRMTLRGLDAYGGVCTEFARALYAMCLIMSTDDFSFQSFFTEMRNNRAVDGTAFVPCDGINLTVELQKSGNATLRLSKELVARLNAFLGV